MEEEGGVGLPFVDLVGAEHGRSGGIGGVGEAVEEFGAGEGEGGFFERGIGGDAAVGMMIVEDVQELVDAFDGGDGVGDEGVVHALAVGVEEVGEFASELGFDLFVDVFEVSAFEVGDGVLGIDGPAGIGDGLGEDAVGEGFGVNEDAVAVEDDEVGGVHWFLTWFVQPERATTVREWLGFGIEGQTTPLRSRLVRYV